MTLQGWRLMAIIFFAVAIFAILILLLFKPLKNKYDYNCREDKLLKTEKKKGARYNVFGVLGRSAYYLDKYVLKQNGRKKTLICDYVRNFKFISYYILLFNKHDSVIKIMEVNEYNTAFCSKPIKLPKKCVKLNIVVKNVDDQDLNINLTGEVSKASVIFFSIVESIALFCFLFGFRHLLIELICFDTKQVFLRDNFDTYSILLIGLFALINYFIISSRLKRTYHLKAVKVKKRGK